MYLWGKKRKKKRKILGQVSDSAPAGCDVDESAKPCRIDWLLSLEDQMPDPMKEGRDNFGGGQRMKRLSCRMPMCREVCPTPSSPVNPVGYRSRTPAEHQRQNAGLGRKKLVGTCAVMQLCFVLGLEHREMNRDLSCK